jgi:DNA gyrase inhibitor GyrI
MAAGLLWQRMALLLHQGSEETGIRCFAVFCHWRRVARLPPLGSEEPSGCAFAA